MVIGILQFDLLIHAAESLKDKRRVVQSVKDRLHREHLVSIAEIALHDNLRIARLGLALVGGEERHVAQSLDRITSKLQSLHGAELGDVTRDIIHGSGIETAEEVTPDPELDHQMRRHVEDSLRELQSLVDSVEPTTDTGGRQ